MVIKPTPCKVYTVARRVHCAPKHTHQAKRKKHQKFQRKWTRHTHTHTHSWIENEWLCVWNVRRKSNEERRKKKKKKGIESTKKEEKLTHTNTRWKETWRNMRKIIYNGIGNSDNVLVIQLVGQHRQ